MSRRRIGLTAAAIGMFTFFLGLYGVVGAASAYIAGMGLVAVFAGGIAGLVTSPRPSLAFPHPVTLALIAAAFALHGYEGYSGTEDFPAVFFAWSMGPYVLLLAVSSLKPLRAPSIAGAAIALAFDALIHYQVFVHPTSSTAAIALLFAPIWNALVFIPIAVAMAWQAARKRKESNAL